VAREDAGKLQVAGKGSQKGKIANRGESERNHHQGRKETVQGEQEENQRLLLREKIGFFMRSGSKGKKEPWQMAYPVRRIAASAEFVFETAVKPFHNPIGLWVKGSCVDVLNLQKRGEV
jgi:hypothetical protein